MVPKENNLYLIPLNIKWKKFLRVMLITVLPQINYMYTYKAPSRPQTVKAENTEMNKSWLLIMNNF